MYLVIKLDCGMVVGVAEFSVDEEQELINYVRGYNICEDYATAVSAKEKNVIITDTHYKTFRLEDI